MNTALPEPPAIAKREKNLPLAKGPAMPQCLDANTGTHEVLV